MSDENEKQILKSVLSPYVPEFVPQALANKLNQNYNDYSQNARENESLVTNVQQKCDKKQANITNCAKKETQTIVPWRQEEDSDDDSKGPISSTKYNLNYPERNWRYRRRDNNDDNDIKSPFQKDITRNQNSNKAKKTISFHSTLRAGPEQDTKSHRGFGRGRGRPRTAWTDGCDSKGNSFRTLDDCRVTAGCGRGRGLSYSDTLKGVKSSALIQAGSNIKKDAVLENDLKQVKIETKNVEIKNSNLTGESENKAEKHAQLDSAPSSKNIPTRDKGKQNTKQTFKGIQDEHGPSNKEQRKQQIKENPKRPQHENKHLSTTTDNDKPKGKDNNRLRNSRKHELKQTENAVGNNQVKRIDQKVASVVEGKDITDKQVIDLSKNKEKSTCHSSSNTSNIEPKQRANTSVSISPPEKKEASTKPVIFGNGFCIKSSHQTKNVKLLKKGDEIPVENHPLDSLNDDGAFPDLHSSNNTQSLASDWLAGGNRMPIISYSAALKTIPKPQLKSNKPSCSGGQKISSTEGVEVQENQPKKKKKRKKKKKDEQHKPEQPASQATKKTKQPMQLDLGDWITTLDRPKNKTDKNKKITLATGVLQIKLQNDADTKASQQSKAKTVPAHSKGFNALDSTAPLVKRGKEREIPKKKKPSPLKKIILKEREEKKKLLDGNTQEHEGTEDTEDSTDKRQDKENIEAVCDKVVSEKPQENSAEVCNSELPTDDDVKAQIHSRRFREYCDNVMDKALNKTTTELLQKLVIFQDRQYHKDPIKSKAKRRFVVGLREVTKHLKLKKIKLVIISPNVERIKSAGGLDDTLHNIITIAHQNGAPVVFALRRQIIGRILHKKVPVSAVGVFNYDGAQDYFKELMELTEKARAVYAERWKTAYDEVMERIHKEQEFLGETSEELGKLTNSQEDSPSNDSSEEGSDNEGTVEESVQEDILKNEQTVNEDIHIEDL